jgi:phosphatidylserine decarboxylase
MEAGDGILYWNRRTGQEEREQILGGAMVHWLYSTRPGNLTANGILDRRWVSRLVGAYQSSPLSRFGIPAFVRDYHIDMQEYLPGPYRSFNEFFVRRFRPGSRVFCDDRDAMPAFAEGRYLAYEALSPEETFPVKGTHLSPAAILGRGEHADSFLNGPVLIARLCPVDYHRFHYPADGRTLEHYRVPGQLHSVNPVALRYRSDILATNERQVSILETEEFGRLAYVEIGAMCVGKIVQLQPRDRPFKRGDEKGYFSFGASTIVLFGEAGRWVPEVDLLEQTARQRETLVRLGEPVARISDPSS